MEKIKRVYAKPTILKVQLSHEQAVLAACSSKTTFASTVSNSCNQKLSCRRAGFTGGSDSFGSS